jgi:hypothetical protein
MNCHRVRTAIVERELSLLSLGFERALDDHLASCSECRVRAEKELMLVEELGALKGVAAPRVHVRAQVLERLAALPRIERAWVSQGELAWASAAAVGAAAGLVAWIWPQAGWLRDAAGTAANGTRAVLSAAYSTVAVLKDLLVLSWRVLGSIWDTLAPLFDMLSRLEPLAVAAISMGLVTMMLTIGWVVGNDLRRPLPVAWRDGK